MAAWAFRFPSEHSLPCPNSGYFILNTKSPQSGTVNIQPHPPANRSTMVEPLHQAQTSSKGQTPFSSEGQQLWEEGQGRGVSQDLLRMCLDPNYRPGSPLPLPRGPKDRRWNPHTCRWATGPEQSPKLDFICAGNFISMEHRKTWSLPIWEQTHCTAKNPFFPRNVVTATKVRKKAMFGHIPRHTYPPRNHQA